MDSKAHTPWVAAEVRHGYDQVIRDAKNNPICSMLLAGWDKKSAAAHVALIVKAVNMHDDLVKALDECVHAEEERLKKLLPGAPASTYTSERLARLKAVLARTKE